MIPLDSSVPKEQCSHYVVPRSCHEELAMTFNAKEEIRLCSKFCRIGTEIIHHCDQLTRDGLKASQLVQLNIGHLAQLRTSTAMGPSQITTQVLRTPTYVHT